MHLPRFTIIATVGWTFCQIGSPNLNSAPDSAEATSTQDPILLAWGETAMFRNVETQAMFIRHEATEAQKRAAISNAQIFFEHLTPAKKEELKKHKVREVLIPTIRSKYTSPKAKDVRMRVDLEAQTLVDNNVYEFEEPLKAGTVAKYASSDPEYVTQ